MIDVADLAALPGAIVTQVGAGAFASVQIDTRKVAAADLFVALVGARDGHDFVPEALVRGAAGVMVSRPVGTLSPATTVVQVPDTLIALQQLGAAARQRHSGPVIAITGSVGKTTTKAMVARVLQARYSPFVNVASFNNHIGVPLTLLGVEAHHSHVVSEVGTNHRGEIAALARLIDPDLAVVTTVGFAHIGNFESREDLAAEKTDLLRTVRRGGHWVVNADDQLIVDVVADMDRPDVTRTTIGFRPGVDLRAVEVKVNEQGTWGVIEVDGDRVPFALSAAGRHVTYAALVALAIGRHYGVSVAAGVESLRGLPPQPGRAQVRRLRPDLLIIDDSYNASPDAMMAALGLLDELSGDHKVAVLGEMRELGRHSQNLHRSVGSRAAAVTTQIMTVGSASRDLLEAAGELGVDVAGVDMPSARAAGAVLVDSAVMRESGDKVVLVKGSRFMHMERVSLMLTGTPVACELPVCELYINCADCPKLITG